MQRHEVPLRGAESWGGGGWGRTAKYEPSGGVVPSRCLGGRAHLARATTRVAPTNFSCNSMGGGFVPWATPEAGCRRAGSNGRRGRACPVPLSRRPRIPGAGDHNAPTRGARSPLRRSGELVDPMRLRRRRAAGQMHGARDLVDREAALAEERGHLDHPQPRQELLHEVCFGRRKTLGAEQAVQPATVRPRAATGQVVGGQCVEMPHGSVHRVRCLAPSWANHAKGIGIIRTMSSGGRPPSKRVGGLPGPPMSEPCSPSPCVPGSMPRRRASSTRQRSNAAIRSSTLGTWSSGGGAW